MAEAGAPLAIVAAEAAPRQTPSLYPEPFASLMAGRTKRPLGDLFGIANFGVNLTTLEPGASSALLHRHLTQDEFVFVVEGELVLVTEAGEAMMTAGMCAGFAKGGAAHRLENRGERPASFVEVGDRSAGDRVEYPADDLVAVLEDGGWSFRRRDGTRY